MPPIRTKHDIIKVNQKVKEITDAFIDSRLKTKMEHWLDPDKQRMVKRCGFCSKFAEYINDDEKLVVIPHNDDCDLAALENEQLRQIGVIANAVDLIDGSHNLSEIMSHIPPGTETWEMLNDLQQGFYDGLEEVGHNYPDHD